MNCQQVQDDNLIERYITEKLSQTEAEAFEKHYLECKHCFEQLGLFHATALELSRHPIPAGTARTSWMPAIPRWALASAVAALAVALIAVVYVQWPQEPVPSAQSPLPSEPPPLEQRPEVVRALTQLAMVEAEPYLPSRLRGEQTSSKARFEAGMQKYVDRDYKGAIEDLAEATRLDPGLDTANFYLGVSYLLEEMPDEAISRLAKLASPQSAYEEESHWYLAKAYLKKTDVAQAMTQFDAVISMNKGYSSEARDAMQQLRSLGFQER